ncbi:YheC/YheD family protein [Paenibacillus sp. MMS20-IR301]|uniref:YheC/YheD family endospore coat-associated protein n=1 Tax=Paenibacillus sp. MMS20-IR301 TaxID=2895946 RepID=UPI0028E764B9|nr:YheC/YheD family protein [Paenibacillus sp. MMS20-IR301]WNS46387.1 YheC/YheD family protein [Paenibacillus sp. MMS20-IR301]
MTETQVGFLGIMTGRRNGNPPISEPEFCSQLSRAAPLHNLKVLVFHPEGVADDGSSVNGYFWDGEKWQPAQAPPPDILYNRCFYRTPEEKQSAAAAMHALSRSLPWSRGLPDKWGVYGILRRSRRAAALLPETAVYSGRRDLGNRLAEREYGVFLKPRAGSHGRKTLHAVLSGGGELLVRGRDKKNEPFQYVFGTPDEGLDWIHRFIGRHRYIIQPYLHLISRRGQPFDVRVLMQKNGSGAWMLTGMAVRLGRQGSLTSNLHGGGTAVPALPFLLAEYGEEGRELLAELASASALLPPLLEAACGRLGELGLDFGIDAGGRLYLLEANSKPGRTVFRLTGDRRAARLAAENPLRYARHLLLTSGSNYRLPQRQLRSNGRMISMVPKEDS